jgi:hypothetical protein
MTARGNRTLSQTPAAPVIEFPFDLRLQESKSAADEVYALIETLITSGAQILYMRYIESQKIPYASRTLGRELVLNASWASIPLDINEPAADPDDDLVIPPIDEWAGGVLPVRDTDTATLRTSVTPQREFRQTGPLRRTLQPQDESSDSRRAPVEKPTSTTRPVQRSGGDKKRAKAPPVVTEGQIIMKQFEEARKKSNISMKAITVDSDFTVIPIQEPKGLPPALIVPKIGLKAKSPVLPTTTKAGSALGAIPKGPRLSGPRNETKKKRMPSLILAPDVPVFDDEGANISYTEKFVCAPGVTLKDGTIVKSRPPAVNSSQMTRNQYESYLEEMKRSGD